MPQAAEEIEDVDGAYAETLTAGPARIAHVEHAELRAALLKLPKEMREALIAVGYWGSVPGSGANLPIALSAPFAAACIERANAWARSWASKVQPILPRRVLDSAVGLGLRLKKSRFDPQRLMHPPEA